MLGCSQHFTRVTFALGSAASEPRAGMTIAAAPEARIFRSDLRSIIWLPFRCYCGRTSYHRNENFLDRLRARSHHGAIAEARARNDQPNEDEATRFSPWHVDRGRRGVGAEGRSATGSDTAN